jgi:methylenetetrahydrofolate reductase (NADPH)
MLLKRYPQLSGVNIPDVLRLPVRSDEAAHAMLSAGFDAIPHLRAIDHPADVTLQRVHRLIKVGLQRVLVIHGDAPTSPHHIVYDVSVLDVIRLLKQAFPSLKVYAALDPYRQSFQQEIHYANEKLKAGADGFFTQPFFDVNFARVFLDHFRLDEVFLGVSPVITESSFTYWVQKNHVVFPSYFQSTLRYATDLAKELMDLADSFGQHTYHMPIRVPADEYLAEIWG